MKRTASIFLLFALMLSGSLLVFGQKRGRAITAPVVSDGSITFDTIQSVSEGQGVVLRWQTSNDAANFGFYVYRVTGQGRELVNAAMIPGAVYRPTLPGHPSEPYELYDTIGDLNTLYSIEYHLVGGAISSTPAFGVQLVRSLATATGRSRADYENIEVTRNSNVVLDHLSLDKELSDIVEAAQPEADLTLHRWVVSQPGAKIAVQFEGFYRVTRAQLEAAGFNVNSPSANWRLFMEGVEQAINVGPSDDYIEFYGMGRDTPESDTRIYYLLADTAPGLRIPTKTIRNVGGAVMGRNYRASVEKREEQNYDPKIRNGEAENYFGRPVTSSPMAVPIEVVLSALDTTVSTATIRVKLQGLFGNSHNVRVMVNGNEAGFLSTTGATAYQATFTIPTSFLVEGTNQVDLYEDNSANSSYFDSLEISYPRRFEAAANRLAYFTPGYRRIDVTGFTTSNVRVFDTTYPGLPQEVVGLQVLQEGAAFTAKLPSHRAMVMYAAENSAFLAPTSVTFNNPSTLSTRANHGPYLVISHSDPAFMAIAQQWANYRATVPGGGYVTKVVDVADIMDEFNYGSFSANAIRDFLQYAHNTWATGPNYVLFLGDSSYDPRNYTGFGRWNLVPTKFVDLIFETSGSDEALADFNHDGLAEMALGRIPARDTFVLNIALNKTLGFETLENQSLDRGGLYAYDLPQGFDFEGMSYGLRAEMPTSMPSTFLPRGLPPPNQMTPDPNARQNLLNALNTGMYIVNYAGHGTQGVWGSTTFFSAFDPPLLTNTTRQSIFTMLTCYNGVFFRPEPLAESVSERLLFAQNGGGGATWASTTETTPDFQFTMGARFYNEVGASNLKRIGDLIKAAKSTIAGSDVGYSWVLLGDPALKVR